MRKIATTFLVLVGFLQAYSQNIQWANSVIEVSSERSMAYQKEFALGKPGIIIEGNEPAFWSPSGDSSKEFIKVGFETPLVAKQIIISETMNGGSISEVYGYDASGKEFLLRKYNATSTGSGKKLTAATMPSGTAFQVAAVKIVLDGTKVSGQKGIDGIGITTSPAISYSPVKLGEGVNTGDYHEINPILSPDGNRLFFSRRNHPDNVGGVTDRVDIWYSDRQGDSWGQAVNMGAPLNNPGFNFIADVSADGEEVILGNVYGKKDNMKFGVSKGTKNDDGSYGNPVRLDIINFHNYDAEFNFTLSKNKEIMIISADMDETEGGRDLYVSFVKNRDKNQWTYPTNLGNVINTAGQEVSPYLAQDNVTLYFTSTGHDGYGAGDVFMSKRLDDTWTNWSEPVNLGPFVNNNQENAYFVKPEWSQFGFFAIGEDGTNADIYTIRPEVAPDNAMVEIKGRLLSGCDTSKPLGATITITGGGKTYTVQADAQTGAYSVLVESGHNYTATVKAEGHKELSESINVEKSEVFKSIDKNLCPEPEIIILSTTKILFDFDRATLRPASRTELDRTYEYLREAQVSYIVIAGHTDSIGTEEYNMGLSERRAKAVVDYLVNKGFSRDKIRAEWFGESKPVDTNATREGRQNNRRTEITIYR
jgi:outer membrane protein OmpA-like peptidoglycan-associated protein